MFVNKQNRRHIATWKERLGEKRHICHNNRQGRVVSNSKSLASYIMKMSSFNTMPWTNLTITAWPCITTPEGNITAILEVIYSEEKQQLATVLPPSRRLYVVALLALTAWPLAHASAHKAPVFFHITVLDISNKRTIFASTARSR